MVVRTKIRPKKTLYRKPKEILDDTQSQLIIGASAACLLGATALIGYFAGRRANSGNSFKSTFNHLAELTDEYMHDAYEKGSDAYGAAKDTFENIRALTANLFEGKRDGSHRNLILGAIATTILGAASAYYFNHKDDSGSYISNAVNKWGDISKGIIEQVSDKVSLQNNKYKKNANSFVDNILDLASIGINVWQEVNKRR